MGYYPVYDDLRGFIEEAKKVSEWRDVDGADWDREIGAIVEASAELIPQAPMLIFDNIKDYPRGYRLLSLPYASYKRVAVALGLPTDLPKLELLAAGGAQGKVGPAAGAEGSGFLAGDGERLHRRRRGPVQVPRAALPRARRRALPRHRRQPGQRRPRQRLHQLRHLPDAAPRPQPAGAVDEPGAAGAAHLHALLGAGQELPGGGHLRPEPAGVHDLLLEAAVGPFRARDGRRTHGPAHGIHPRSGHGAADSGQRRDRHRGRDPAAVGGGPGGRAVRRMAGLLLRGHHRHGRGPARHTRQGALPPQRSDPGRRRAHVARRHQDGPAPVVGRAVGPARGRGHPGHHRGIQPHLVPGGGGHQAALRRACEAGGHGRAELPRRRRATAATWWWWTTTSTPAT